MSKIPLPDRIDVVRSRALNAQSEQTRNVDKSALRGRPYQRARDLIAVLPLWPEERDDTSIAGYEIIVGKLKSALRRERQRGRVGHWAYDLNRHQTLVMCYQAETRALAALRRDNWGAVAASSMHITQARLAEADKSPVDAVGALFQPSSAARAEPHLFGEL